MTDRYESLPKWARDDIESMRRGLCWHCGRPPYTLPPARATDQSWTPPLQAVEDCLEAIPARLYKLLGDAEKIGWHLGATGTTIVMRLHKPGDERALPFYVCWQLVPGKEAKMSWRFSGARAANGQPLSWADIRIYLADPEVIYPEPDDEKEAS